MFCVLRRVVVNISHLSVMLCFPPRMKQDDDSDVQESCCCDVRGGSARRAHDRSRLLIIDLSCQPVEAQLTLHKQMFVSVRGEQL